ncbi:MAG: MFS transporter [Deltaproteobacteria bacterium]|jgi:MFS family permease|nr:MFS transporter [Deltaproteobacteria bacterium]
MPKEHPPTSPPPPQAPAPELDAAVKPPLWTRTFFTFLFVNLCVFMGFNMLLPTLPLYLEAAGLTEQEIGIVFGSFTISAITARITAGRLSGLLGAVRTARAGLFVCAGGTLVYFLHDSIPSYVAARLLQGLGFGLTSTLLVSLASQTIPPSRMGEGLGYLGLGATVALAIGPYSGLYAAETYGFVAMFVGASACCVAAGLVSLLLPRISFPRPRAAAAGKPDAGAGKPDAPPMPAAPPDGTDAARRDGSGADAVRTAARANALLALEAKAASPTTPAPRKRLRVEWAAVPPSFLMLVYGVAASAIVTYLAVYAKERGMPSAAEFFVVSTAGTVVSRLWAGRLFDRKGHFYVIPPAVALIAFSIVSILVVPGRALMDTAAVCYGMGAGALFPSLQTLALTSVPPDRRTTASAYFFVSFDIGMGAGSVVMGGLAGLFSSYRVVYVAAIVCMAFFAASYFLIFSKGRDADGPGDKEAPGPRSGPVGGDGGVAPGKGAVSLTPVASAFASSLITASPGVIASPGITASPGVIASPGFTASPAVIASPAAMATIEAHGQAPTG